MFPGILRLGRAKPAVAGAQHHGDVAPEAVAAGLNSRVAQRLPRRRDGVAQIVVFILLHFRPGQPRRQVEVLDLASEIAAEMLRVETRDRSQSVPSRAQGFRNRCGIVSNRAGDADAGDGRLPAHALALHRLAENLRAALPGGRFQTGRVLRLLPLEKLAPQFDELLPQLFRRQIQRAGDHVCPIVMRPVEIENAPLPPHPVPMHRAGIRRENKELRRVDLGGVKEVQHSLRNVFVVPVPPNAARTKKANAPSFERLHQFRQHLPLARSALERADGNRVHVHRAIKIAHAGPRCQVQKFGIGVQRQRGGDKVFLPQRLDGAEEGARVFVQFALRKEQRVVGEIHIFVLKLAKLLHHALDGPEPDAAAHLTRQRTHAAGVGTAARQLHQVLVPIVMVVPVEYFPSRNGRRGKIRAATAPIKRLQTARRCIRQNALPGRFAFAHIYRVRVFETFVGHERREQPAHDHLLSSSAELVRNLERACRLGRETIDRHQVRRRVVVDGLPAVVIQQLDLDPRRRERCENGNAQRGRSSEAAQKVIHQPPVQLRQAGEELLKARINKSDFHTWPRPAEFIHARSGKKPRWSSKYQ